MALDVECPKCNHKMQMDEKSVGQCFHCPQCHKELILLVGGAVAEPNMDDLRLQELEPSQHLNSRREIKPRGKSGKPAWRTMLICKRQGLRILIPPFPTKVLMLLLVPLSSASSRRMR